MPQWTVVTNGSSLLMTTAQLYVAFVLAAGHQCRQCHTFVANYGRCCCLTSSALVASSHFFIGLCACSWQFLDVVNFLVVVFIIFCCFIIMIALLYFLTLLFEVFLGLGCHTTMQTLPWSVAVSVLYMHVDTESSRSFWTFALNRMYFVCSNIRKITSFSH